MFKESGIKNSAEKFEKGRNIDWNSLDLRKIQEQLFKYSNKKEKEKLNLIKNEEWENGHHRVYCNEKGKVIRVEKGRTYQGDWESSASRKQKEYEYAENGNIESIRYFLHEDGDYDGADQNDDYAGEIKFEYSQGRIVKADVKEVCSGYDDRADEKNYKFGKDIVYNIEYDKDGKVKSVQKEERIFGKNGSEKTILFDRERDKNKNLVFEKMNAAEIVEWDLTRSNDMNYKK